jgi:iron-sulfur cluster assembly accessory protein
MQITPKALQKIASFLSKEDNTKVFRIGVSSGGCSGFSYKTEISDLQSDDLKLDESEAIVIDPASNDMLKNTVLDYVDEIGHSGFIFTNPDASSTCGCGISFDF